MSNYYRIITEAPATYILFRNGEYERTAADPVELIHLAALLSQLQEEDRLVRA